MQVVPGGRRASYLATASAVVLSADDGEGSLAGDADATGFIRHPVRRVYRMNKEKGKNGERGAADTSAALRKENKLMFGMNFLTFELALAGLGCHFR